MLKLLFISACLVGCLAAPLDDKPKTPAELTRPAPINPDVPSDPKPKEKVTLITDPAELAKFKREIKKDDEKPHGHLPGPVVLPDQKKEEPKKQSKRDTATTPKPGDNKNGPKPQTLPSLPTDSKTQHKRDVTPVSGTTQKTPQISQPKPQTLPVVPSAPGTRRQLRRQVSTTTTTSTTKAPENSHAHTHKRDVKNPPPAVPVRDSTNQRGNNQRIPAPATVPKNDRPKRDILVSEDSQGSDESDEHPVTRVRPVPVSELFASVQEQQN